jgi:hypothetical protein
MITGYQLVLLLSTTVITLMLLVVARLATQVVHEIGVGPIGRKLSTGFLLTAVGWIGMTLAQIGWLALSAPHAGNPLTGLVLAVALIGITTKGVGTWLLIQGFYRWRVAARQLYAQMTEMELLR